MTTARRAEKLAKPGQTSGRNLIYRPPAELSPLAARLHSIGLWPNSMRAIVEACGAVRASRIKPTSRGRRTLAKPPPARAVNGSRFKITIQHFHRRRQLTSPLSANKLPVTTDREHLLANSAHSADCWRICSGKIDPPKRSNGPDVGGKIVKST